MYVSYLLDKDVSMYPSSVRHSGSLNLAPQNFVSPPQYPDYGGYHVAAAAAAAANLDSAQSPGPSWPAAYGAPLREDWNEVSPRPSAALPPSLLSFLLAQLGRLQVTAPLRRFIANYSRINQSAGWGPSLDTGFCGAAHIRGAQPRSLIPRGCGAPTRPVGSGARGAERSCSWSPSSGGPAGDTERAEPEQRPLRGTPRRVQLLRRWLGELRCAPLPGLDCPFGAPRASCSGAPGSDRFLLSGQRAQGGTTGSPGREPGGGAGDAPASRKALGLLRSLYFPAGAVKTRTKDKYRVVYTDHQRLELEKEFHYSRYITIRRKAELAATLGLSERQVKIWFQNRRAKERKINKKQQQQQQQQQQQPPPPPPQPPQQQPGPLRSVQEPLSPVSSLQGSVPGSVPGVLGPTGGVLNPTVTQ
ncbi:PREDICTED: homeobox protein CDX-2 [Chinchilla lanigera]|nr:PREDICTED: homeobox protein CDX-2 [Chinchilla lanigera]